MYAEAVVDLARSSRDQMIWQFLAARLARAVQNRNDGQDKHEQNAPPQDKPTGILRISHFLEPRRQLGWRRGWDSQRPVSAQTRALCESSRSPLCQFLSNHAKTSGRASLHQLFNKRASHIRGHARVAMDQRSFVQDRLRPMQGGDIRALEEFPDGDLLAPK